MVHRRPIYIHLLNVPSFSSRYFNKIKRKSHLGRVLILSLEILFHANLTSKFFEKYYLSVKQIESGSNLFAKIISR